MPATDLGWACLGVAGAPRVRRVTTEGVDRDCSSEGADPRGDSAWAIGLFSARVMIGRNDVVKRRTPSEPLCIVRTLVMGPRLFESASLSHKCSPGESHRIERGEARPPPFLLHEPVAYWMAANMSFTSGVLSFLSAFASIWRIRSLVTERLCPTCSSVHA